MGNKIKKSFSISVESEAFIRRSCRERKSDSESETLDALLSELRAIRQKEAIEAAYAEYYESLTDEEIADEQAWGTFTQSQLVEEVR
jgi:hypothetical protein